MSDQSCILRNAFLPQLLSFGGPLLGEAKAQADDAVAGAVLEATSRPAEPGVLVPAAAPEDPVGAR